MTPEIKYSGSEPDTEMADSAIADSANADPAADAAPGTAVEEIPKAEELIATPA